MRVVTTVVLLAWMASTAAAAPARMRSPNKVDLLFVDRFGLGNAAGISAGWLCIEKCRGGDAKAFGQMMVEDHTRTGETFSRLVLGKEISMPVLENPTDLETQLANTQPDNFDREYLGRMVRSQKRLVDVLQLELKGGADAELMEFARRLLPRVLHHLAEAERVAALVKGAG